MGSQSRMLQGAIMFLTIRVSLCAEGRDGPYDGLASSSVQLRYLSEGK
jgi:hypothetical protein